MHPCLGYRTMRRSSYHLVLDGRILGDAVSRNLLILTDDISQGNFALPKDRAEMFVDGLHCLGPILGVDRRKIVGFLIRRFKLAKLTNRANSFKSNIRGQLHYD
jgi:hypothetical protein